MNHIYNWELDLIVLLQNTMPWLRPIMQFFTSLGEPFVYILVMLILIWCLDYRFGIRYASIILCSSFINSFSKIIVRAPRPYFMDKRIHVSHLEKGYGMPSGHAQNSTVGLITLGNYKNMRRFRLVFIIIIMVIGLSRVYLGYHSPLQVIAGWFMGACIIGVINKCESPDSSLIIKINIKKKSAAIFLLWLISMVYLINYVNNIEMKVDYMSKISIYMGTLLGIQWGSNLFNNKINTLKLDHSIKKMVIRLLVGMPVVLAILYSVKKLEKTIPHLWVSATSQYMLMIGLGLWVSYGALIVFKKLNILEKKGLNDEKVL